MAVANPHKFPRFNTMKEMMDHYYPDSPDEIQKVDAPLLSSTTGWYNVVYGKKVWAQLNYEANVFGILPKKPWTKSGFRVESDYPVATSGWPTGGVAENTAITAEDSIKPTWVEIGDAPKTILHHFDSSELAAFLAGVDDSVDAIAELRKTIGQYHVKQINEMLMTNVTTLAGDNIESIDRMVSSYSEVTNCADVDAGDSDVYGMDRDAAATWYDAIVNENGDTDRVLTLKIIDETLKDVMDAGGKPKVILTGFDTLFEWQSLLEAQRRFMQTTPVIPSFGGVRGAVPGVEAGFMVSTYHGIPIIPTHRCTESGALSNIFFLDTDYLYLKVARPTQYMESGDMLALDRLGMRGAYHTMAELTCTRFNVQAKIRDLVAA